MEWKTEYDNRLKELYSIETPRRVSEILQAEFNIDVSEAAVKCRAQFLEVYNRHGYDGWSREEVEIIRKYYPTEGKRIASRLPNRAIKAIQQEACRLGVRKNKIK